MKWKKYFFIAWAVILAGSIAFAVHIRHSILPLDMTSSGLEKDYPHRKRPIQS